MSEEKLNAKLEQVTGSAKELAGKVFGDTSLEAEGAVDKLVGKAKELVTNADDVVDQAVYKAKKLSEDAKGVVDGALKGLKNAFDKK